MELMETKPLTSSIRTKDGVGLGFNLHNEKIIRNPDFINEKITTNWFKFQQNLDCDRDSTRFSSSPTRRNVRRPTVHEVPFNKDF